MPITAVVIVAAGRGARAGSAVPKQFRPLVGVSVLRRSVDVFAGFQRVDLIQPVAAQDQFDQCESALAGIRHLPLVAGGATRQDSVRNGLAALEPCAPDFVLIHDAARPLVSEALIARVVGALEDGATAAIPLLPVADSLKRREGERWSSVGRDGLYRAQTPQGFRFDEILAAHRKQKSSEATDDMAIAERAGIAITPIAGEERNLKITTDDDFAHATALLLAGLTELRTGQGFDTHRFTRGDHVWLCGVRIAHEKALEGHSDADVGLHALTDAILGALGAGDIGEHFPPTDEKWRGAPSSVFVTHAARLVAEANGGVVHCDVTILCERPKIAPHREAMRTRIAELLHIDIARISVKATTTEGLGFIGRGEGIAAQAIATLRLPQA